MSSVELMLTQAELMTQQCPSLNDSTLEQAIAGTLVGIVTYIKIDKGCYQTLSRFEDDVWVFPASKGTKSNIKSELNLSFIAISDPQMKRMAKWIMWSKLKKGLALGTLRRTLNSLKLYFSWINSSDNSGIQSLTTFTAKAYVKYVNALTTVKNSKIKPISEIQKAHRLKTLEELYHHCKAFDFVKEHPWPESSSNEQAGYIGEVLQERRRSKTSIIPNEVLVPLCQFTKSYLDRADELLALRDKLDAFIPTAESNNANWQLTQKRKYLHSIIPQYQGLHDFNKDLWLLRDSCIFWLLLTTGMRIHEVLGIKRGAYRSEAKNDMTYYYIETVSSKTKTGLAEWIAPEIATQVIDILDRYSFPLQGRLESDLFKAKANNNYVEVHRLEGISNHVLLTIEPGNQNSINLLSCHSISGDRLPNLCNQIDSNWNLSAHQFRRTFANYVAHSELGDLRALKDHFKHWSITMTALYAFNESLDAELFEELLREKYLEEEQIKQDLFDLDMPITGGKIATRIKQVREDDELIKTFGSREEMVKAYSSSIPIRSTGIGWCTNDDECKCGKPDSCDSGIVDKRHLPYWEGMLIQQMKLLHLDDIGEAGKSAVEKGMERCEKVLSALGVDVEAMKLEINQRDRIGGMNV
ncbi:site-specific integrase [Vibrio hibernica]|uniref:site-specific integrase n=1 Tax=Vibrio hibernica TaxID=2587465 RepID=UPI001E3F9D52|nr:site-specific integrase [Vibrio hibernica]